MHSSLLAEYCIERKQQGAQQNIFIHLGLMAEFLESLGELQTRVARPLFNGLWSEGGNMLEEGNQRRIGAGCRS